MQQGGRCLAVMACQGVGGGPLRLSSSTRSTQTPELRASDHRWFWGVMTRDIQGHDTRTEYGGTQMLVRRRRSQNLVMCLDRDLHYLLE